MSDPVPSTRRQTIKMGPRDDVAMVLEELPAGTAVAVEFPGAAPDRVTLVETIPLGHKFALRDLKAGEKILKYGMEIGTALKDIPCGAWVGEHNCE
jgi:hypothetical protein